MPILTIDRALSHLRVEQDEDDDILSKLASAEDIAQQYLNRNVYQSLDALIADQKRLDEMSEQIESTYLTQVNYADSLSSHLKIQIKESARINRTEALDRLNMVIFGTIINPSIEAAILLILGHLYENREDVSITQLSELPKGAIWNLNPYRINLGV